MSNVNIDSVVNVLNENGFFARPWTPSRGGKSRVYVKMNGQDIGYLSEDDFSGASGTCKAITRRSGFIAGLLRDLAARPALTPLPAPSPEPMVAIYAAPLVTSPVTTGVSVTTNKRAGACEKCGTLLQAGEGHLRFCLEDTGCLQHHDRSGHHLACLNAETCEERATANKQAREAEKAEKAEKAAQIAKAREAHGALVANLTQGLVPLDFWPKGQIKTTLVSRVDDASFFAIESSEGCAFKTQVGGSPPVYFYSQSAADALILAWGDSCGGEERAHSFLAKYKGCKGAFEWTRYLELKAK